MGVLTTFATRRSHLPETTKEQIAIRIQNMGHYARKCFGG